MPAVVTQERRAFLMRRHQGIGGSDAAAVLGVDEFKSPLEVYAEKIRPVVTDDGSSDPEHIYFGHVLEEVVAQEYARRSGHKVRRWRAQLIHPQYRHMRAHVDRFIYKPADSRGVLQIKTAAGWKVREWDDGPPLRVLVQVQHEMYVAGVSWGAVAVLLGGNQFRYYGVTPNARFVDLLVTREAAFWQAVERRQPPDLSEDPMADARALAQLYQDPVEGAGPVDLPADAVVWDATIALVNEEMARLKLQKIEAENHIKAALGNNQVGLLPDGGAWLWKIEERTARSIPATSSRVLRRRKAWKERGR